MTLAFHLPSTLQRADLIYDTVVFGRGRQQVQLNVPVVTPELLSHVIYSLRQARESYLARLTLQDIIERLHAAVSLWSDPAFSLRLEAEAFLPLITSYSAPMVHHALDTLFAGLKEKELWTLVKTEFRDPLVLDELRVNPLTGGWTRAYGPALTTVIFSGNAPGLPAVSMCCALLVKSACLGKSASGDPLSAALFAQSIAHVDAQLADATAVLWWKGGTTEVETLAFSQSDLVIAYGGNPALESVSQKVPRQIGFARHGHKFSCAIVGREALSHNEVRCTAHRAAYDVSMYDQQACMSPHILFVEAGGEVSPRMFAPILAEQMDVVQSCLPKGNISPGEMSAIQQLRGAYDFRALRESSVDLYCSTPGTEWTIIYEPLDQFVPSCLNRTIRLVPISDVTEVIRYLRPLRGNLQSVGIALPQERLLDLAEELGDVGVSRLTPLGQLPHPVVGWHHDGHLNLASMVRWLDVEQKPRPNRRKP